MKGHDFAGGGKVPGGKPFRPDDCPGITVPKN
jgi:hypothetical protein